MTLRYTAQQNIDILAQPTRVVEVALAGQGRPATSARNARQAAGPKVSAGPAGSLLSRTPTTPGRLSATSTQLPPDDPLRRDLRQMALVRSMVAVHFLHQLVGLSARECFVPHVLPPRLKSM